MAIGKKTYGVNFPFIDSIAGDYVGLTKTPTEEVKANLVHLLLTKKGSRYMMPTFGTNLYQYLFETIDDITMGKIENEIIDACAKYMPNLKINSIELKDYGTDDTLEVSDQLQHQITINIDYEIVNNTFSERNSVTINF